MEILHRNEQISELCNLLRLAIAPGSSLSWIHLYGCASTGKTSTVLRAVESLRSHVTLHQPHIWVVNCAEASASPKHLFQCVLSSLCALANQSAVAERCDSANDFVKHVRSILSSDRIGPVVLVLRRAEHLRRLPLGVHAVLRKLRTLTGENITIVSTARIAHNTLYSFCAVGFEGAVQIHFPNYTKDQLLDILFQLAPTDLNSSPTGENWKDLYRVFVAGTLDLAGKQCRDLMELKHLVDARWPRFYETVRNNENVAHSTSNPTRFWPHLKSALDGHESTAFLRGCKGAMEGEKEALLDQAVPALPVLGRYLLVSSYLASYNPAKLDARLFKRAHVKSRRHALTIADSRHNEHNLGPKAFTAERLRFIFFAILGQEGKAKLAQEADFQALTASLAKVGMLTRSTADGNLEAPKFRCAASLPVVKRVARQIHFNIMEYLFDFMA